MNLSTCTNTLHNTLIIRCQLKILTCNLHSSFSSLVSCSK
uniref:Uncharacterized protein n=1 Tax=Heterorhabditis bacteriophora TaxID=37862 RepID=A0A1I7WKC3_HETBA